MSSHKISLITNESKQIELEHAVVRFCGLTHLSSSSGRKVMVCAAVKGVVFEQFSLI